MLQYQIDEISDATRALLKTLGEDPLREGLLDTPIRVAKAWGELTAGYQQSYKDILATEFVEGACSSMVILKDCHGWSTCEHHLLPFSYVGHIGYIPDGKVVGISKLARLLDCFGRRLQIQERFVEQVANAIVEELNPRGVMVIIEGQHLCMKARGVKQSHSVMTTSAIRGEFDNHAVRSEFMALVKG